VTIAHSRPRDIISKTGTIGRSTTLITSRKQIQNSARLQKLAQDEIVESTGWGA